MLASDFSYFLVFIAEIINYLLHVAMLVLMHYSVMYILYTYICNTLRGRHQSLELWYITDIPQFAVVYQNIPQLQGYIPQLPYTACLALMRLRSA